MPRSTAPALGVFAMVRPCTHGSAQCVWMGVYAQWRVGMREAEGSSEAGLGTSLLISVLCRSLVPLHYEGALSALRSRTGKAMESPLHALQPILTSCTPPPPVVSL